MSDERTTEAEPATASASATAQDELRRQIEALGPWFHNLHLPGGVQTVPDHFLGGDFPRFKWLEIAPHIPQDLSGWRVLSLREADFFRKVTPMECGPAVVLNRACSPASIESSSWSVLVGFTRRSATRSRSSSISSS